MPLLDDNLKHTSVSVSETEFASTFRINMDFLNECSHHCPGCFANRANGYCQEDLEILLNLAKQVHASEIKLDEMVLGPVDILGSSNGLQVLQEPTFIEMLSLVKPILVMPTTFQCEDAKLEQLLAVLGANYPHDMQIEFQIVIDVEKVSRGDIAYQQNLKRKINILDGLPQPVEYIFLLNIRKLKPGYLQYLSQWAREEFNCFLGFSPSVFRSGDAQVVSKVTEKWNEFLRTEVTEETKHLVPMPLSDKAHGWFNQSAWSFGGGHLYISPNIFDQVVDFSEPFRIPKEGRFYELCHVLRWLEQSWTKQAHYAERTNSCASCEYLPLCSSRQALTYMKAYGVKDCPYPRSVMQLYS